MSECTNCNGTFIETALSEPADKTCPAVGYQKLSICVPVSVTPFAKTGNTKTKCCGDAVVVPGEKPCPGKKNGVCAFTISQTICVEVPVEFGAVSTVGDTYVECLATSADDICMNCGEDLEL